MKYLAGTTGLERKSQQLALQWAEKNLPDEEFQEIKRSYETLSKRTIRFVLLFMIPVMLLFLSLIFIRPFSNAAEAREMPQAATDYFMATVDYDGNFFWTRDSKIHELPLEDYGLDSANFKFLDSVKVFVDDSQNIIEVKDVRNDTKINEIEIGVGVIGSILVPVLMLLVGFKPIAYRTFGKPWIEFYRNL